MIKKCKFYTSVKSGVTMSRKSWIQLISKEALVASFSLYDKSSTLGSCCLTI